MGYSVGQLVIVVPNQIRENGFVGKVEKLEKSLTDFCGKNVYLVKRIDGSKINYYESDLRGVGDELADDIIDEICEDGKYFVTDMGNKWVLYIDDLYYCKNCNEVQNSLDSAEKISYVEDKIVGEPKFYEPTEEKEVDMFMVGYLECLNDIVDWLVNFGIDDDNNDSFIYKALRDMNICYLANLKKEDYSRFYSLVMKYKEEQAKKPKLTLADIKEKLGYDFELVD